MTLLFTFLSIISLLNICCQSQSVSCDSYSDESSCKSSTSACEWKPNRGECACSSLVKLDILLALDKSGSIGLEGWLTQKNFTRELVEQGISAISRIGFSTFSTTVNKSRPIQYWDYYDLETYVEGLFWSGGWTNTKEMLDSALIQFTDTHQHDRHQILVLITDGNPCGAEEVGGCPHTVCEYKTQFKISGIKIAIVGVGDGLTTDYVACLLDDPTTDFMHVNSFARQDFNAIKDQLSQFLCPLSDITTNINTGGHSRVILTADAGYWIDDYQYTDTLDDTLSTWINTADGVNSFNLGFRSNCNNNACVDSNRQNQVWGFWTTTNGDQIAQMGHFFECDRNSIVDYSFTAYFCKNSNTNPIYIYVTHLSGDRASGIDNQFDWIRSDGSRQDGTTGTLTTIAGSGGNPQPHTTCDQDLQKMDFSASFETVGGVPFLINIAYDSNRVGSSAVGFNNFRVRCVFKATTDPTESPTMEPTISPTFEPSMHTSDPTDGPTPEPTISPTLEPTVDTLPPTLPTSLPTRSPLEVGETHAPTHDPTPSPSSDPTLEPTTSEPTENPTQEILVGDANEKIVFWILHSIVFVIFFVV